MNTFQTHIMPVTLSCYYHNYQCWYLVFPPTDGVIATRCLCSQTFTDGWSALLLILPRINTIAGLTLQNWSQAKINGSVTGSEPAEATEPSKVTALTRGCDWIKSAGIRDAGHQSEFARVIKFKESQRHRVCVLDFGGGGLT